MSNPARESRRVGICCCSLIVLPLGLIVLYFCLEAYWPVHLRQPTGVVVFSPDSSQFAYVWRDANMRGGNMRGDKTLTDALDVRWYPTLHPENAHSVRLVSSDWRDRGGVLIHARSGDIHFSPDSKRLAAVSEEAIVLVDMATGRSQRIVYPNEWFRGIAWTSAQEIVFSTGKADGSSWTTFYWKLNVLSGAVRRRIQFDSALQGKEPHPLNDDFLSWAANGRFVVDGPYLADVTSGKVYSIDFAPDDVRWRPGSSEVLMTKSDGPAQDHILLMDAATGATDNLLSSVRSLGPDVDAFDWTADGRFLVAQSYSIGPPERSGGYLIQPRPFQVVLQKQESLSPSPLPGWLLIGEKNVRWTDYMGMRSIPMKESANNWTWSPSGVYAAEIQDDQVRVFRPQLPH